MKQQSSLRKSRKYLKRTLKFLLTISLDVRDTLKQVYILNLAKQNIHDIIKIGFEKVKDHLSKGSNKQKSSNEFLNDEDFIFMINALSSNIKEYFRNSKKGVGLIKSNSENVIDLILTSKSSISDINLLLGSTNNLIGSKYSQKPSNKPLNETYFKDKLSQISLKLESANDLRANIHKSIKFIEQNTNKFYDEAKIIFKKLKQIHTSFASKPKNNEDEKASMNNNDRGRFKSTSPIRNLQTNCISVFK